MGANAAHKICRANKNKRAYQYGRYLVINATRACEEQNNRNVARLKKIIIKLKRIN